MITLEVEPRIAQMIRFMAESGVFAVNKGSATLNFVEGHLNTIKLEIYTQSPKLSPLPPVPSVDKIHAKLSS